MCRFYTRRTLAFSDATHKLSFFFNISLTPHYAQSNADNKSKHIGPISSAISSYPVLHGSCYEVTESVVVPTPALAWNLLSRIEFSIPTLVSFRRIFFIHTDWALAARCIISTFAAMKKKILDARFVPGPTLSRVHVNILDHQGGGGGSGKIDSVCGLTLSDIARCMIT